MWVDVQLCRGPTGERLKAADWRPLGRGRLTIRHSGGPAGICAKVERLDVIRWYELGPPLFNIHGVLTHGEGFLLVGFQIDAEAQGPVIREYRQAWYCVPSTLR